MAIAVAGATKPIGLALPGGGFRTTALLLEPQELCFLDAVVLPSDIESDGIAGVHIASNWRCPDDTCLAGHRNR